MQGKSFEEALDTRCFEPDAPNFTPRISAALNFANKDFTYKMSILKSADEKGTACNRYTFSYAPLCGILSIRITATEIPFPPLRANRSECVFPMIFRSSQRRFGQTLTRITRSLFMCATPIWKRASTRGCFIIKTNKEKGR